MNGSGDALDIFNIGFSTLSLPVLGKDILFSARLRLTLHRQLWASMKENNVLNEASCLRVVSATNAAKIEIQNTAASGRLYGIQIKFGRLIQHFDRTTGV